MPYLSFLAINYDIPAINDAQKWFESCIIRSYANPEAELQIMLSDNKTIRRQIISALNDMGIDINGYRYDNDSKQLIMQRTLHGKPTSYPIKMNPMVLKSSLQHCRYY